MNIPGNTMVEDFDSAVHTNAFLYKTFTDTVEKHLAIRDCGVDIERFNKGYTMFLFDLSALSEPVDCTGSFPCQHENYVSRVISHDMF